TSFSVNLFLFKLCSFTKSLFKFLYENKSFLGSICLVSLRVLSNPFTSPSINDLIEVFISLVFSVIKDLISSREASFLISVFTFSSKDDDNISLKNLSSLALGSVFLK